MDCKQCGACCRVVVLPVSMEDALKMSKSADALFVVQNLTPITREVALALNPFLSRWEEPPNRYYYVCQQFDCSTNKCRVHGNKPAVCEGFPWYGSMPGPINRVMLYSPDCEYWQEAGPDDGTEASEFIPWKEVAPFGNHLNKTWFVPIDESINARVWHRSKDDRWVWTTLPASGRMARGEAESKLAAMETVMQLLKGGS